MPATYYTKHDPDKQYLRFGTVRRWLMAKGFSWYQVQKWRVDGVIKPVHIGRNGCLAWFDRDQIKRDILNGSE